MAGTADVAVIGGSASYSMFDNGEDLLVDTPYGMPSAALRIGEVEGGSSTYWRGFPGPHGRLDQAERERRLALAAAHTEGISIRTLATVAGLSASRVHQLVAAADLDTLDAASCERAGARRRWPTQGEQRPGQPYHRCSPRPGTDIR